jgi:hypothetical protein
MLGEGDEKTKGKIAPISGCQDKRSMRSNLSTNGDFVYTNFNGLNEVKVNYFGKSGGGGGEF